MSNPATQFKPGNKCGRGRPKSGRSQVIDIIDKILEDKKNQKRISEDLEKEFKKSPLKFIEKWSLPLTPKQIALGGTISAAIIYNLNGPNGNETDNKSGS